MLCINAATCGADTLAQIKARSETRKLVVDIDTTYERGQWETLDALHGNPLLLKLSLSTRMSSKIFTMLLEVVASASGLRIISFDGLKLMSMRARELMRVVTNHGELQDLDFGTSLGLVSRDSPETVVAALRAQRQVRRLILRATTNVDVIVSEMGHEETLEVLRLSRCYVARDTIGFARKVARFTNLRVLDVEGCFVTRTSSFTYFLSMLAGCVPELENLDVSKNRLEKQAKQALGRLLLTTPRLQKLALKQCGLTSVSFLLFALENHEALMYLSLSGNHLNEDSVAALCAFAARKPALKMLSLNGARIDNDAIRVLTRTNLTLERLCLEYNRFYDEGFQLLTQWVRRQGFVGSSIDTDGNSVAWATREALMDELDWSAGVLRPTLALLGESTRYLRLSPRRFVLDCDGDHAIWSRVVRFLYVPMRRSRAIEAARREAEAAVAAAQNEEEAEA